MANSDPLTVPVPLLCVQAESVGSDPAVQKGSQTAKKGSQPEYFI